MLKEEMKLEEIHLKVNAIHRLRTVIFDIGPSKTVNELIPYLEFLVGNEDDEVLYAIAEEIGKVFHLCTDKTLFMPLLKKLAGESETVVREEASRSLNAICG